MTLIWNSRISKYRSVPTSFLEWVVLGLLSLLDSQLLNRKMSLNAVWLGATLCWPCSARCQRKGRAGDRRDTLGAAGPPGTATPPPAPLLGAALLHPNLTAQGQRGTPSTSTHRTRGPVTLEGVSPGWVVPPSPAPCRCRRPGEG